MPVCTQGCKARRGRRKKRNCENVFLVRAAALIINHNTFLPSPTHLVSHFHLYLPALQFQAAGRTQCLLTSPGTPRDGQRRPLMPISGPHKLNSQGHQGRSQLSLSPRFNSTTWEPGRGQGGRAGQAVVCERFPCPSPPALCTQGPLRRPW